MSPVRYAETTIVCRSVLLPSHAPFHQILCATLNQNSEGERFAFLDARRVLIVADPPEGQVK